jgi:hypothetical protein
VSTDYVQQAGCSTSAVQGIAIALSAGLLPDLARKAKEVLADCMKLSATLDKQPVPQ